MLRGVAFCFGLALMCTSFVAQAEPTASELQAARDLFRQAQAEEDRGQWAAALDKLRRAASVKQTPGILFHIALCEEKLGLLLAALADYGAAEQGARAQSNQDVLEAISEPLRLLRVRIPTLTLDVPTASHAEVEVDGRVIASGLYGIPIPVEPGVHHISAHADGMEPFTADVRLGEREAVVATIRWVARRVAAPPVTTAGTEALRADPSSREGGGVKWGAIVASVSAVGLVAFGVGSYLAADGAQSSLAQTCATMVVCSDSLKAPVRTWDAVALTGWIAAAGVAVVAVVLWAQPGRPATTVSLGPASLTVSGAF